MIDRHYGHLARDGREHAIRLLDELSAGQRPRWTLRGRRDQRSPPAGTTEPPAEQEETRSPLTDSNRRPPPYHPGTKSGSAGTPGSRRARKPGKPGGSHGQT